MDDLLKAHKILMKGILKNVGSFRGVNVGVGNKNVINHIAPPYNWVPNLMRDLFNWLKKVMSICLLNLASFTMNLNLFTLLVTVTDV